MKKYTLLVVSVLLFGGLSLAQVTGTNGQAPVADGYGFTFDWGAIITSTARTYWAWIGAALMPIFGFIAIKGGFGKVMGWVKNLLGARR